MRYAIESGVKALTLVMLCGIAVEQLPENAQAAEESAELGNLIIGPPVNINGPFPEIVYEIGKGDLMLLQVRYPVAPPLPQSATAASASKHVELVASARTSSEVAILERKPRAGGQIGVGYVQVLVRGASVGRDVLTIRVKGSDGSIKQVPFGFEVK